MAKSLLNITASFYMAHILLMAASYEHPAQYSEGASLDGKLKKIWKNTKWHLLVFDANKYLKQVAKAAKRQKVSPIELEEIQRHISNIKQFSGKSTINYKRPKDINSFFLSTNDPNLQLKRLEELFCERHILPYKDYYQKLFVHCICARHGIRWDSLPNFNPVVEVSANEMFENGLHLQQRAQVYLKNAINSNTFYDYLSFLNMAGPCFQAAVVAFGGAKRRFSSEGNRVGTENAESERFVSEEWSANCQTNISMFGSLLVYGPFGHLRILKVQSQLYGVKRTVDHLINYLVNNDVIFPKFCGMAWDMLSQEHDAEDFFSPKDSLEANQRKLDILLSRYTEILFQTLDSCSSTLLSTCLDTIKQYQEIEDNVFPSNSLAKNKSGLLSFE